MRRLSIFVLCAAFHALALSTGCGGGDPQPVPDAGPEQPPPVPDAGPPDAGPPDAGPVDLRPPTVISYLPEKNATGVPPETMVEVTFNEEMQPNRGTVQIIPGTGLPNNGVLVASPTNWDVTLHTVRFSFPEGLPLRKTLTVNIANFADAFGNPMQGVTTFSFTVSDGVAPAVSSSTPAEGASGVALGTNEITLNFNQPMDKAVGALVPSNNLTLGTLTWVGNQSLKVPITSQLANDQFYSVRLDNFRNANQKDLDGAQYLGDGKLDFGTGPDLIRPTVREASPREGATGVSYDSTRFVVISFSEPMDTGQGVGKAELVDVERGTRTLLPPSWSADGFVATYNVEFKLRPTATMKVDLSGFKDRAGNPFDPAPYLGDGSLNFTVAGDTVKPFVSSSNVLDGTTDVYPVEVYKTGGTPPTGYRKVFTFGFSEPMDQTVNTVRLAVAGNPGSARTISGAGSKWSTDGRTLTVTIEPESLGQLPLLGNTEYTLDLTALKDVAGNPLDAALGAVSNGLLHFGTVFDNDLLDHACVHALSVAPTGRSAPLSANSAPNADADHGHYEVTLAPSGSTFEGYIKMQLPWLPVHHLFLSQNVAVAVSNPAQPTTAIQVTRAAVPPACPSDITHRALFSIGQDATLNVKFGPSASQVFRFVYEEE
jgi:hypothetical protein